MLRTIVNNMQKCLSPYPSRHRLPGDRTPKRQNLPSIEGPARRCITHALTFHSLPRDVDLLIERLPSEEKLEALSPLSKDYLSFTVYSLKQMVASGTISADTAWGLFNGEWKGIDLLTETNYQKAREGFLQSVWVNSVRGDNVPRLSGNALLTFEFFSRAGSAGLAQFDRYGAWADKLIFEKKSCADISEPVRDEYRKALWLEMRTTEGRIGLSGLAQDIREFILRSPDGFYRREERAIGCSIDVFRKLDKAGAKGMPLDRTIKAEVGHWMFGAFRIKHFGRDTGHKPAWVSELMDRMNCLGFSERMVQLMKDLPADHLPPEVRVFTGGQFLSFVNLPSFKDLETFPTYPMDFPGELRSLIGNAEYRYYVHPPSAFLTAEAEYVENLVRERVTEAFEKSQIRVGEVYRTYRRLGVYIVLLHLEGKSMEVILQKVRALDLKEINDYYSSVKKKTVRALMEISKTSDGDQRESALAAIREVTENWRHL